MTPKYTDWRARYPNLDAQLRSFVRGRLGIRRDNKSEFAERTVDQWVVGVLGILLKWNGDQAPTAGTPPETPSAQLTDAKQLLDLEERS